MTTNLNLAPNVTLRALQTDKFKTGCFSINLLCPHCAETAALDALLPSVLLRATEHYPDIAAISAHLDELYGASVGTLVRRKGEVKLIGFYGDYIEDAFLPEGESIFGEMVSFLEEIIYHPLTENGCFCTRFAEGEKQNLINAIESELNDKRTYATAQLLRRMCQGEAYGVPRLGTAEAVRAITPQALWTRYQTLLRQARIELFYAGRLTPAQAAAAFSAVFAGRERTACIPVQTQLVHQAQTVRECTERLDVAQGKLVMGLRTGITCSDRDYPALLLLNAVYGGCMTSKLFTNVREKRSLCYYASSSLEKYKGVMLISSGIAFADYDAAKSAILQELNDCKTGNISAFELESARRQVLSALRVSLDSPIYLDDFYIGGAVAETADIPELMQAVQALQTEDLTAAARKLSLDTVYFLKGVEA